MFQRYQFVIMAMVEPELDAGEQVINRVSFMISVVDW